MNVKYLALVITLLAANAHAGSEPQNLSLQRVSVYGSSSFVIDCYAQRTPTLHETSKVLGTEGGALQLSQPQHLANIAHHECMKGAARVVFVRDASPLANTPARAIAEVTLWP
jgi:hypothetical protein